MSILHVNSPALRRRLSHAAILACVGSAALGLLSAGSNARADFSFKTLHDFNPPVDGSVPYAELTQGADGKFYGTNTTGGRQDHGTVFSLNKDGSGFNTLSAFPDTNGGATPRGGVVQARDGNFYGTTFSGGQNGLGTLYRVTPAGTLSILSSFNNGDPGANPESTIVEGANGFLYGTAEYGGQDNFGTVFRASVPAGVTATFSTFQGDLDGAYPESDLIQAYDGSFYGTTGTGGTNNAGTFFRVSIGGVRTILYDFVPSTDGSLPLRGVIQGIDGAFYGITQNGGPLAGGVIYRIVVSGTTATLTPLHPFAQGSGSIVTRYGRLLQASDGNFYGTTDTGGAAGLGQIFRITPGGAFAVVYSFGGDTDGEFPASGLTQGADGKLYGTTAGRDGTIYKVDLGLAAPTPRIVLFSPTVAQSGDTVLLKGRNFVGTTAVNFVNARGGSVAATSFQVASATTVSAVVPTDAVTGLISVVANGQTGLAPQNITINSSPAPTPTPSPSPGATATVTVVASDPVATFAAGNNGRFRITRSGEDLTQPLTVIFKIGGRSTAVRGVDYDLTTQGETLASITNSITIPAGRASIGLKVIPLAATSPRPDEKVILKVQAGAGYTTGASFKAVINIAGDGG